MSGSKGAIGGGILLLLLAAFAWRNIVDTDFGIHMASGRWIVENRRVPESDPFTYTVSDRAYLAYHWLFQAGTYVIYRDFGVHGLTFARWAILLGSALLVADLMRIRRVPAAAWAVVGLAAILASEGRFRLRPELLSILLATATLWTLERHRQRRRAPLWLLPIIQLLWINTHVYAFGWAILLVYLADEVIRRRSLRGPLAAWSAASFAVLFLNPYHVRAVVHPLYLATRMRADNVFAQTITELASPISLARDPGFRSTLAPQLVTYGLLLALGGLALWVHLRRRSWTDVALVGIFGALSALAVRNLALYAVVTAPSLAAALGGLLDPASGRAPARRAIAGSLLVATLGFAALTAVRVALGGYYAEWSRPERFSSAICRDCLAVDAADWLADHHLTGPGFNNLNMGATLLWRDPAHKVFIDGRNEVTGEAFFKRYLAASTPPGFERAARSYGFEYAILAYRHDRALSDRLLNGPGWKLVHIDGAAIVFVREGGPNDILPAAELPPSVGARERWRELRAIRVEEGPAARLRRWLGSGEPPLGADFGLGTWLLNMRRLEEAERPLLAAARRGTGFSEAHNNLGVLYYRRGLWKEAWLAFRNLRALDPDHPSLSFLPEITRRAGVP